MNNLVAITPFFIVKELAVSIACYVERFGFQVDVHGPPDDVYYARVSRDGVSIMLKAIVPPRVHTARRHLCERVVMH